ncbi:hypothetical protein [Dactylosporangium darangshiense]|uniref:hypothetical protein n=1 Tax=Dactylosporangium darangshiense TaxID=579108 RepID=UPI00362E7E23
MALFRMFCTWHDTSVSPQSLSPSLGGVLGGVLPSPGSRSWCDNVAAQIRHWSRL